MIKLIKITLTALIPLITPVCLYSQNVEWIYAKSEVRLWQETKAFFGLYREVSPRKVDGLFYDGQYIAMPEKFASDYVIERYPMCFLYFRDILSLRPWVYDGNKKNIIKVGHNDYLKFACSKTENW
tara:strand:- start:68 stop:445 length:378 start_codon:yes stop_codon:yes gene_type:complete